MKISISILLFGLLLTTGVAAQQTETRNVPAFSKLEIGGSFNAVMRQGNETSVKIIAENIDLNKILTETNGSTLKVSLVKGLYHNIKIKLEITYKSLEGIYRSGSGNLTCESDLFAAGNFDLHSSGSGNITIKGVIKAANIAVIRSGSGNMKMSGLQADQLKMTFSGSGNCDVNGGNAKAQSIHLSGSGNVSAYDLQTENCSVSVSGSGNIEVSASNAIEAFISGSGNIGYRGNARVTKMEVHGSGKVNKKA